MTYNVFGGTLSLTQSINQSTTTTHCHVGQQQQPGLAQWGRLLETNGAKFCQQSDQAWPLPRKHLPDWATKAK